MAPAELKLAIEHPEFGPRIRQHRILTPQECDERRRIERLRKLMTEAKALAGDGEATKHLRARLESAMDDVTELQKLEKDWISEEERLLLGQWPEGVAYLELEESKAIAEFVLAAYRNELRPYKIAFVFMQSVPPVNRRGRLGTAAKLAGKVTHISGYHAVITLGFEDWRVLSDKDRQRLVHHEIEHLEIDDGLKQRTHDFEEFVSIAQLYGLRSDSQKFSTDGRVADFLESTGSQLELITRKAG